MLRASVWLLGRGGGREKREHRGQEAAAIIHVVVMGVARSREDAVEVVTHGQRQIGSCCNRLYVDGDVTDLMH